ncbi:ParA family protein [Alistipes indistinctus]|uniref:CobQ/CobB/MinD/ParA nucleotide binding domain-containing protein n=1 Tax=Alistipes indistinctus YIT 12060 TaxID=742725 RepID=G5HBB7_9BACT|nr:hypothetical protein [Alistipes indistinctus]EHB91883.1 hypothetical protein HMPREF9450_01932 [Alistipes indistinctus YIT 12060]UWN59665.1 ParA family protein [Alistipes indistinctus YIT 12060]
MKRLLVQQHRQIGRKAYSVLKSDPERAHADTLGFLENDPEGTDVVLFDMPGTLNTHGVFRTLSMLDYLFVPILADRMVVESSIMYSKILQEQLIGKKGCNLKGIFHFWASVDKRVRTDLYDRYDHVLEKLGLSSMKTRIPARSKFSKEISLNGGPIYRSTLFASDNRFVRDARLDALASEICAVTKLDPPCLEK